MDGGGYSRNKISCVFTYGYLQIHYTIVPILMNTNFFGNAPNKKF